MKRERAFDKRGLLAMRADLWGSIFGVEEPGDDFELRGNAAIVSIEGPLTHHAEWFWDSYDAIKARVSAALESSADVVVLKIDSPGGECAGCFETARELRELAAGAGKRIVAFTDGMAASAAYALSCGAGEVYLAPTAFVGSIGVISTLVDITALNKMMGLNFAVVASGKKKTYGHPDVPLSDAAIAETKVQVDTLAELFFELVAGARSMSRGAVVGLEAGMLIGADAVAAGLADRVCTFDELLSALESGNTTTPIGAAAEETMGWKDEMKKAAEEGDEDAKKCAGALDGGDDDPPESKKEGAEEKKDGAGDDAPPSKKEGAEEKKEDEKASARRAGTGLEARLLAIETERERDRLLATRPDLTRDQALAKKLASAPIETVRWSVANLPRVAAAAAPTPPSKAPATSPLAHAGASTPGATRGADENDQPFGRTRRSDRADELDEKLGWGAKKEHVIHHRNETSIRLMTPSQAREHLKKIDARNAATNGGK